MQKKQMKFKELRKKIAKIYKLCFYGVLACEKQNNILVSKHMQKHFRFQ